MAKNKGSKFKKGDLVRLKPKFLSEEYSSRWTIGKIYVVTAADRYGVYTTDDEGRENGWGNESFELVDTEAAKVLYGSVQKR